jgi:hypothetical protein
MSKTEENAAIEDAFLKFKHAHPSSGPIAVDCSDDGRVGDGQLWIIGIDNKAWKGDSLLAALERANGT